MARHQLAERRRELGLTQEGVAEALSCAVETIQRYEAGRSRPRPGLRRQYAGVLRWSMPRLAVALNDDGPDAAAPAWLGHLAGLEAAADRLCAYEAVGISGLLQTPGYALAVEQADAGDLSPDVIARRVELRMARQCVLDRPDPLTLDVILDEAVLYRTAGDVDTMAAQLDHLAATAERPHVTIRVLPLRAGVFPFGSFTILSAPGADEPHMAITEDRAGPQWHDRPHEIAAHAELFDHLAAAAMSPAESLHRINAAKEMTCRDDLASV